MAQLPEEFRVAATLYFMEGLNYEEIAQTLECPVGTVRSRLHRSIKVLQQALWQVGEKDGIVSQSPRQAEA